MIQKALGFGFLFVIAPLCTGLLWRGAWGERKCGAARLYLSGFLTQFAVFQLIAVPVMIWLPHGMDELVLLASGALALLSAAGAVLYLLRAGRDGSAWAVPRAAGGAFPGGARILAARRRPDRIPTVHVLYPRHVRRG